MKRPRNKKHGPLAARSRARRRALQALYQWEIARTEPTDLITQFNDEQDMSRVDGEYFAELVREVIGQIGALDEWLGTAMDRSPAELDLLELATLRIGAYELRHRIEVPFKVIIHEAVNLAAEFGSAQAPGFVNAVLDRLSESSREIERAASSGGH